MTNLEYQTQRLTGDSLLHRLSDIIEAYSIAEGTERDCALRDVLTDLRHFAQLHSLDFEAISEGAYHGYVEERMERDFPV